MTKNDDLTPSNCPIPPTEKYVNPFTDYGFKRIFGEEPNKGLLKDFLNDLLHEEQGEIKEIQYLNNEQLGDTSQSRKAYFDLYCTNEKGERFIVELQKTKQNFFKDRTVYYSTFPIREQAKRGDFWDFELKAVYTIAILDFVFDEDKDKPDKYLYNVKLTDQETKEIFYDKLTFVYLAMPKFTKTLDETENHLEKFLFILNNLTKFQGIPEGLKDEKFVKLFKLAEVANFNQHEFEEYEASLKEYWDLNAYYNTAIKEGREEGIEIGIEQGKEIGIEQGKKLEKIATAQSALAMGLAVDDVVKLTGLTVEEINDL